MSNAYGEYKAPGGGGAYFKFEAGVVKKLRICSDAVVFMNDYQGNVSTKYGWVVWNYDEKVAQVLQLPVTAFRMIQDLATNEDWGDPTSYDIKVKREGTGTDTKYSIQPVPNSKPLDDEAKEAADKMDIFAFIKNGIWLSEAVKGKEPSPAVESTFGNDVDYNPEIEIEDMPEDFLKTDDEKEDKK